MLSKRLLEISKLVDKNKVVFDVGSDHALLPCFLVLNNICPKVYACDNKVGPLNKAKENIKKYHLEDKVIPILGNGIDNIFEDVDIITISGMGFFTIKEILEGKDLRKYSKIIIQINKDNDLLRAFINDNKYSIINEVIVNDGFFYEILVIDPNKEEKYNDLEIKYGPILLKKKDKIFIDYLNYKKDKYKDIYQKSHDVKLLEEIKEIDEILLEQ